MEIFFLPIITYLVVFFLIFFHSFIVRYFPVKKSLNISPAVRFFSFLILFIFTALLWVLPIFPLLVKIAGTAGFAVLFILSIKSIKEKKLPLFEKWIICLPYYLSIYFGYLIIKLKYVSFFPYAQKVICPACYRLNKPKHSKEYEKRNYLESFSVKTENNVFTFNRNDPFYRLNHGMLRFGRRKRFCLYCGENLMTEKPYMKLVCVFGDNIKEEWDKQTFVLKNPDVSHRDSPVDLSALYIDPAATDIHKLERFVTFVMNHPPKGRPEMLPVYYYGDLTPLGDHMKNLLENTFKRLKRG